MTNQFFQSLLGLLAVIVPLAGEGRAETFEFLTFAPPSGWTRQTTRDGIAYRRASGIGLISFAASRPAAGPETEEFARAWRERVAPTLPGDAPAPQIERGSGFAAAVGGRVVSAPEGVTAISLVVFTARGRVIAVLALATGDDAIGEVNAFFDTVKVALEAVVPPEPSAAASNAIKLDFEVPPAYVSKPEGRSIAFTPQQFTDRTPCVYGVSPARPSKGSLEADARAAILEMLPGWRLKSDHYSAMRGVAADGWNYYWFRTDVQSAAPVDGSFQYLTAMTTAIPGAAGTTNIVWGFGPPARCQLDDLAFAQLFHSLRPHGWVSDGGKALARELVGTWRDVQTRGVAQYKFSAAGRYEFGIGTVTRFGLLETTASSVRAGRYRLSGGELTLASDRGEVSRYRVRIYDHYNSGGWRRAMSLLKDGTDALDVQYFRIED